MTETRKDRRRRTLTDEDVTALAEALRQDHAHVCRFNPEEQQFIRDLNQNATIFKHEVVRNLPTLIFWACIILMAAAMFFGIVNVHSPGLAPANKGAA